MPSSNGPMLEDKQRFSDSSFSASASAVGHTPSDSRLSSGSSWCAPASDKKHYLQIDFGRQYRIYYFLTYGNNRSPKWVAKYNVNYTTDLINWKSLTKVRNSNIKAVNIIVVLVLFLSLCFYVSMLEICILLLYFSGISRKQKCL